MTIVTQGTVFAHIGETDTRGIKRQEEFMQVKLKVIGGRNDGREIKIGVPEFVIGRGDDANLKPSSDLVSRHHCKLKIAGGALVVSDMGSRNGTFVNGAKLEGEHIAKVGDTLRVGRLQFEILIDHGTPGNKKPKVAGVAEAAARTVAKKGNFDEDSITDWLNTSDEEAEASKALNETQHFSLEDTPTKMFVRSDEMSDEEKDVKGPEAEVVEESDSSIKKKKYKKLPPQERAKSESSKSAADDVLRKFFNRR